MAFEDLLSLEVDSAEPVIRVADIKLILDHCNLVGRVPQQAIFRGPCLCFSVVKINYQQPGVSLRDIYFVIVNQQVVNRVLGDSFAYPFCWLTRLL